MSGSRKVVKKSIGGITINTIYDLYPPQIVMTYRLVDAFTKGTNNLLELPTGSGKSIVIIATSVSWLQSSKGKNHVIYIASHTHTQLKQLIKESRKLPSFVPMTILGSKPHYCVHPEVSKASDVNQTCLLYRNSGACPYYNAFKTDFTKGEKGELAKKARHQYGLGSGAWDIEDLKEKCKVGGACPYFVSRTLLHDSKIVFLPYPYLIDKGIREALDLNLDNNTIVIIDEAHNIENVCTETMSSEVSLSMVEEMIVLIEKVKTHAQLHVEKPDEISSYADGFLDFLVSLKTLIKSEGEKLKDVEVDRFNNRYISYGPGRTVEAFLSRFGITKESLKGWRRSLRKLRKEMDTMVSGDNDPVVNLWQSEFFERLMSVLIILMKKNWHFRVLLSEFIVEKRDGNKRFRRYKELKFTALSLYPGIAFQNAFRDTRSVSLTSGTLAPLGSFESELGFKFEGKLETRHVIDLKTRAKIGYIMKGPNNVNLSMTYKTYSLLRVQDSVGELILEFAKVIPDGMLVFFPSYGTMSKLKFRWQETGVLRKIRQHKKLFIEPRTGSKEHFNRVVRKYEESVKKTTGGGLLFAVCRGKVSEGVDFSDEKARGVLVLGIPFPSRGDIKIHEKMQYNNMNSKGMGLLTGNAWYTQQGFRALNQALGRCLRHKDDYGVIYLIDSRFSNESNRRQLARWMRDFAKEYSDYREAVSETSEFFRRMEAGRWKDLHKGTEPKKAVSFGYSDYYSQPSDSEVEPKRQKVKRGSVDHFGFNYRL